MNIFNSFGSLAYVHPQKATLTESPVFNQCQLNGDSHRNSSSRYSRNSEELQKSLVKKTKKKQFLKHVDDENPKSNQPQAVRTIPQTNKKKLGFFPNRNQTKNEVKGAQSLDKIKEQRKVDNQNSKKIDQIYLKKSFTSISRNSFQSQQSFSSFQSYSTNRSNSQQELNKVKSNSTDKNKGKINSNQEKIQKNNFGSAFSSVKTNSKITAQQVNPEEKKLQEEKRKYELQLKLIRVKKQEFAKKCKIKSVDWKKVQKAQAKQKIAEKIQICNEGMRVQQNMQKAIEDFGQEQPNILAEYKNISEEMQARFKFFEETVAPYEEKVANDIHVRNELLMKTSEQEKQIEYQKQINSNIQEDNSSLYLQNLLLMEQIAALKSKKQSLLDQQVEIDNENKQLKESADIKQGHLNLLQKHYDEQASRSLWLKKEINLKKRGIFNINVISEKKRQNKMEILEDEQERKVLQEFDQNQKCILNELKEQKPLKEDIENNKDVNYHYTCQIKYLESNKFELLRSITDFEYFTPNQVYGIFYSDDSYQKFHGFLLQFMTFFTCSKIKSCNLVIYNSEGMSTFQTISEDTSFDQIISSLKNITQDEQLLSPSSQNLGFTLHIDILNQQFYLGKQFNIVIACVNQSTSSQRIQNQLFSLFKSKKMQSSSESLSSNNSLLLNNNTNMNNQLSSLIDKIQKKQQIDMNQELQSQKENIEKEQNNINVSNNQMVNEQISTLQMQQNQQIQALKRVKYNDISPMISKNVRNINVIQGTPKCQKNKLIANQASQNRSGTKNNTGGIRSYSEDRSSIKKKQEKLQENLNKTLVSQNQQKQENKYIISFINEYFKKPNRLFTIHFNDHYQFQI
ncbi:hypothetical protein ABPG74_017450 [Tetrahymena malaccensis]